MDYKIESREIAKLYKIIGERDTLAVIGMSQEDIDILEGICKNGKTIAQIALLMNRTQADTYAKYQRALIQLNKHIIKAIATFSVYNSMHKRMLALERENLMLRTEIALFRINSVQSEVLVAPPTETEKDQQKALLKLLTTDIEDAGFPVGISMALRNYGVRNLKKLTDLSEYQVVRINKIGKTKIETIKKVLSGHGLSLAEY